MRAGTSVLVGRGQLLTNASAAITTIFSADRAVNGMFRIGLSSDGRQVRVSGANGVYVFATRSEIGAELLEWADALGDAPRPPTRAAAYLTVLGYWRRYTGW